MLQATNNVRVAGLIWLFWYGLVPLSVGADSSSNTTAEFAEQSAAALTSLDNYLAADRDSRPPLAEQAFARTPLTRADADAAGEKLWEDHAQSIRESRAGEMKERRLKDGELVMPFHYETFGDKPTSGRRLFISMHGGGGAPRQVNDRQWENQKRLYRPEEGVYVAPRGPTDNWNLWHEPHIDRLFDRLIEDMIVFEDVDPNRVYILGYSAGGDGVYQLAPRMADRWAAAAMMAGHPNDALPLGLRNIGFTIHVGGRDGAYNRNKVAAEWGQKLDDLHKADPDGYSHLVTIHPDKPHWLDREDAAALPWMVEYVRNPVPTRVVWKQDDVTHGRFYWLAVDADEEKAGSEITA
ncbi:MAG TPA: polyhydroxyalkanoate depolymerase, partial [Lacipirellulaceae bacterium]|nr:polyhydroxyalkanoate depolymerase [Lacipirellulaceae bacterium]